MFNSSEMLKGILEGMVLEIISQKEVYGYEIVRQLNANGFPGMTQGTVYTILLRLERNGYLNVSKRPSEIGPPRKFYSLNAQGRIALSSFWKNWAFLVQQVNNLKNKENNDASI